MSEGKGREENAPVIIRNKTNRTYEREELKWNWTGI